MRTTLNIDDDVMRVVRSIAGQQGKPVGQVISELVRKGLRPATPSRHKGFPVFDVPRDAPSITPEMVREALDDSQ